MNIQFPLSAEEFSTNIQEHCPLFLKSAADVSCFNWSDANQIIERSDISSSDFKVVKDNVLPKEAYVESFFDVGTPRQRLIKPNIYRLLREGATIIANKISNEPKLAAFSKSVASFTQRRVVSSVYVAFGSEASSVAHWDTRDVFAVQILGRKKWTIFPPSFDSPLHIHQSRSYGADYPCPATPHTEVVLEPGDVLYVPRGWWHAPETIGESTFHLAVGTFPVYMIDYLNWALSQVTENAIFRPSLAGWEHDRKNLDLVKDEFASFIGEHRNYSRFTDFCASSFREESSLFMDIFGNPEGSQIDGMSGLRLITQSYRTEWAEGYLFANGTKLNLSEESRKILQYIDEFPGISLDDLVSHCSFSRPEQLRSLIHQLCEQDIVEIVRQ